MQVETYKIKTWNDTITGLLIKENDDWILIKEVEGDYHVDGFTLLRKEYVKKRKTKKWEKQVAIVLGLQKVSKTLRGFKFGDLPTMMAWIEKKYGLFAFQDNVEESIEIGRVEDIKDGTLGLNFLKADGTFVADYVYDYKLNKIRKVSFATHYLNSLLLLNKHLQG